MICPVCSKNFEVKDRSPSHIARHKNHFCSKECRHIFHRTHGLSRTKIYGVWCDMKRRCLNPNKSDYKYYGKRGIKVCDRWMDFKLFLEDMGVPPEGKTLDRIDNSKGYSPENCKWSTRLEQMNNTRFNKVISFDGESLSISAWERKLGWRPGTLKRRLLRGWEPDRALTSPLRQVSSR